MNFSYLGRDKWKMLFITVRPFAYIVISVWLVFSLNEFLTSTGKEFYLIAKNKETNNSSSFLSHATRQFVAEIIDSATLPLSVIGMSRPQIMPENKLKRIQQYLAVFRPDRLNEFRAILVSDGKTRPIARLLGGMLGAMFIPVFFLMFLWWLTKKIVI